ncbi:MAG TPA: hypothetical protein VK832_11640 [Burkholderiaceae bacterium]|nr:hypothetical protein [Burkholderiaceae bacterium]
MQQFQMSNTAWKVLISALALIAAALLIAEWCYSIEALATGEVGSLGITFNRLDERRSVRPIAKIQTSSPLVALGATVGDSIILDRTDDDRRTYGVGEPIGLTLLHGNLARHGIVNAMAIPITSSFTWNCLSDLLGRTLAILFALLIAFKQPRSMAYRALALYFICSGFNGIPHIFPPGSSQSFGDLMYWATVAPLNFSIALFAIHYPDNKPLRLRAWLARRISMLWVFAAISTLYLVWYATGHPAPYLYSSSVLFFDLSTAITLTALWDGWRTGVGTWRQRHLWLLISIGAATFCLALSGLPIEWQIGGVRATFIVNNTTALLMEVGIAYAVMKHRVFNFGFAVNRAIFYSTTSLVLLVAFGVAEWLSEHFLHFEGREANVFVDGAIALGVYLIFHKIRHVFEHWLDRLFFHKWHANEAALREFVKHAAHITAADALFRDFHAELKRFSGGAICSNWMMGANESYNLIQNPDRDEADCMDVNDGLCVALRAEQTPMMVKDGHPSHSGDLALPMAHRGVLHGFVLLGEKPNREEYRPDEVDVLAFAAHQIGLDLYALQNEQLRTELESVTEEIENLQNSNELLQAVVSRIGDRLEQLSA